jgi:hypothetical protein
MSYIATGMTPEEHRAESIRIQQELLELRKREIEQSKRSPFWELMTTLATVGIPVVTFLGMSHYFRVGGKK